MVSEDCERRGRKWLSVLVSKIARIGFEGKFEGKLY